MISIISLTEAGESLAKRLKDWQNLLSKEAVELCHKPTPFAQKVQEKFSQGHALIFICATGIVVRSLAPVLKDKHEDPPVLILDELGKFIIPLLSGHEGGANEWGGKLATKLGAQLVFTTALPYLQPLFTLGMGCDRYCPLHELEDLLQHCLDLAGLDTSEICVLASIDIKADETALIELAKKNAWDFLTFSVQQLREVEDQLTQRSDLVFAEVGVYGVAEAAALVAASSLTDENAELILAKEKNKHATCAIARSYANKEQTT